MSFDVRDDLADLRISFPRDYDPSAPVHIGTVIETATHYIDLDGVVWCPTIRDWTGDDLAYSIDAGMSQCPECRELLIDAEIEPAHHVDIDGQWYCDGEKASVEIVGNLRDGCTGCGEDVITP